MVDIARTEGVRLAVKSKSMATEEIHLNEALEIEGIEVVETDLGEYIIQLAREMPSHIIAPAIHKTVSQVARLFSHVNGAELPADRTVLCAFARARLREVFLAADMGITGANFVAADTGTIVLVTNEGNGRMCTSLPRVHVAVVPVEKVVPRLVDLGVVLPLLTRSATGQPLSTYVSMVTGPRRPGEVDGPERMHVVLLDHNRRGPGGHPVRGDAGLRAVRRLPQRLPRLPPDRRSRLWRRLQRADGSHPHPAPVRRRGGARSALRLVAVRCLFGSLPRGNPPG